KDAQVLADADVELAQARQVALRLIFRLEEIQDARVRPVGADASPVTIAMLGEKLARDAARLATEASKAQRRVNLLEAQRNLLLARQVHEKADPKTKIALLKKVQEAEKALALAEKGEKQPSTKYTPRTITSYPATSTGRRLALARWIVDRKN